MGKLHSVSLNRDRCMGCTNCIKGCPTEAIRVRDGKACIDENRCIDCGECIRICPHHAKSAQCDPFPDLTSRNASKPAAVLLPPSLYAQFGPPATRSMIIRSMYAIGFDFVYEVAIGAEACSLRTREIIAEKRALVQSGGSDFSSVFPLISSACPVVVRLIQMKYKALIPHLIPFDSPMEITAGFARKDIASKMAISPDDIDIYFLSPCPSKRTVTINPLGRNKSEVNFVLALHDVYPMILSALEKEQKDTEGAALHAFVGLAGSEGVQWACAGGEASTLDTEKYMAVDGIHNVISILDEIENERLKDIEFVEPSCCFGGCIGGPLTVTNPFSAKARMRGFIKAAIDDEERAPDVFLRFRHLQLASAWKIPLEANNSMQLDANINTAMDKYAQMERILETLPGLDCGACGAPTCAALAEDIVQGNALETDCIIKLKEHIRKVAKDINLLDL